MCIRDSNWITPLDDNIYVSQLSIPGTHDAATGDGTTSVSYTHLIRIVKNRGIRVDWQPDDSVSYIWNSIEVEHHPRMLDLYNPFLHEDLNSLETLFGYHDVWLSPCLLYTSRCV